jgi:hypothetical protein
VNIISIDMYIEVDSIDPIKVSVCRQEKQKIGGKDGAVVKRFSCSGRG